MRWDRTLNDWLCLTQDQYYSYFSQIFSLFTLRPLESSAERGWRRIAKMRGSSDIFWNFLNYPICNVTHSQVRHWIFGRRCPGPVHVLANVMQRNINGHQFWHLVSTRLRRRIIWPDLIFSCYDVTSDTAAESQGADPILTWSLISIWEETWFRALLKTRLTLQWCSLQCSKPDTRMNGRAQEQSQTWGHVSHWSQTRRMDSSPSVETHVRPWYWYSCGGQMMLTLQTGLVACCRLWQSDLVWWEQLQRPRSATGTEVTCPKSRLETVSKLPDCG